MDACSASLPGHAYANVATACLDAQPGAHDPAVGGLAGPATDEHFDAPPLLFGRTEGATPFRFSLSRRAMSAINARCRSVRAPSSQYCWLSWLCSFGATTRRRVFAFTFGGSIRAARLRWVEIGTTSAAARSVKRRGSPVALQPLASIDDVAERGWATDGSQHSGPREDRPPHARSERTICGRPSVAGIGARRRAHPDGAVGAVAVGRPQAGPPALLPGGAYGRLLDARGRTARQHVRYRYSRPRGSSAPVLQPRCSPISFIGSRRVSMAARPC